jgi:hypothetical protein
MMVRTAVVLLTGFVGAAALAATPPMAVEPRDEALGLGHAAAPSPAPARAVVTAPAPAAAERVPSGNPLWAIPLRQLSATRERPLFAPSRRPPQPVAAYQLASVPSAPPPKPAEPEKPHLELVGTIVAQGGGMGVFFNPATRSVLRLKIGEGHEGWVLRGLQRREVTLENGRQTVVLTLPLPGTNKAGPALPNGPPPPNRAAERTGQAPPLEPGPANVGDRASSPIGAGSVSPQAGAVQATFTPPLPVLPVFKPTPAIANPFRDPLQIRR